MGIAYLPIEDVAAFLTCNNHNQSLQETAFGGGATILGALVIDAVISAFLLIDSALVVAVVSHVFVFLSTDEEREMNTTTRINEMSYKLWDKY